MTQLEKIAVSTITVFIISIFVDIILEGIILNRSPGTILMFLVIGLGVGGVLFAVTALIAIWGNE